MSKEFILEKSDLGKKSEYSFTYDPNKLYLIPRKINREKLGIASTALPFYGFDYWNHYEVSWLNEKGKPIVALAEIIIGCDSSHIIESKSMKLYFNSFNNTSFKDTDSVIETIKKDFFERIQGSSILVKIKPLYHLHEEKLLPSFQGISIDDLDITCDIYHNNPNFLVTEDELVEEILCTDLFKSNCLVTDQPDWCSIQISYRGKKINREGLLRYIVSFRNDNEFHEQGIEKIFMHIQQRCHPEKLTVYGRSTRRGGLDINSIRSTHPIKIEDISNLRLCRQ